MTSFFRPAMSVGIKWPAVGPFATVMHAAVPSVTADAAPAVTIADSQLQLLRKIFSGGLLQILQKHRMLRRFGDRGLHRRWHQAAREIRIRACGVDAFGDAEFVVVIDGAGTGAGVGDTGVPPGACAAAAVSNGSARVSAKPVSARLIRPKKLRLDTFARMAHGNAAPRLIRFNAPDCATNHTPAKHLYIAHTFLPAVKLAAHKVAISSVCEIATEVVC